MSAMFMKRLIARTRRSFAPPRHSPGSRPGGLDSRLQYGPWWLNSYLLTPVVSIVVFLIVMSLILWSLNRREQQQQEDTLYRNVAWAQQQIRLSLTRAQEQPAALARDLGPGRRDEPYFQQMATEVLQAHPEIIALTWVDATRQVRYS